MRRLKTKLRDKATLAAFIRAHERASRGKARRSEVIKFNLNLASNLVAIATAVRDGTYRPSAYRRFWVNDPKKRLILALPYPDRIVHQWLVEEFIKPYYIPRFIADTYACIPGRGTHAAVKRLQRMMTSINNGLGTGYYAVKFDISKFFNSIDRDILLDILRRRIADRELMDLLTIIIDDGDDHDGIPIGNYISQYLANIYLNELDQYCKQQLHLRYYVRYMDDFICLIPNKQAARRVFTEVNNFVSSSLNLRLNPKSRYFPGRLGIDFAGYRIYHDHILLRRRSKLKIRQILSDFNHEIDDAGRFERRMNSWLGHAIHADSYHYRVRILGRYQDKYSRRHYIDKANQGNGDSRLSSPAKPVTTDRLS